jgi:hypothetical protein
MPTERFAMRHVRDVIRLKTAGMSTREIARRVGAAPLTVRRAAPSFGNAKKVDAEMGFCSRVLGLFLLMH